ncbi:MAG TPA: GatB/YqeY domain-containing protein [Candidatus Aphodoplasma excrementigallinarum]|uniref:GatB/YqeY domain-containing protein n=1 Tax=Candidatus Aphodoplasma excrementigallinarum TaxID=2840673 RepID=A0A9D1SZH6_9FIRM|nr:GatB/YqeY domain-containing protein [Candidatus Aphodoplasma excrementigallinarum]
MSLKERLAADLKLAMKEKDTIRKNTVQMVRSAVLQYEKDNRTELDDDGVIDVIAKELKQRRDSLPDYEKSGRADLVDGLKAEMAVLMEYLPEQLSEEELTAIIQEAIAETGASSVKDMGKVMGIVTGKTKGRADAKMIGALAKKMLS